MSACLSVPRYQSDKNNFVFHPITDTVDSLFARKYLVIVFSVGYLFYSPNLSIKLIDPILSFFLIKRSWDFCLFLSPLLAVNQITDCFETMFDN